MSDKVSIRGVDPEGVADGDYAVTVAGGHVTGLTPASSGGGGEPLAPNAGRPPNLVPTGVKLRGVNIVPIGMTGGTTGDPWGQLFSDPAYFDSIIKPQVDRAAELGANALRCMNGIGWVHNGETALADNIANYERFVDYASNMGLWVYACLSDANHWAGATKAEALTIFGPLVEMLEAKPRVIAVDVVQEIGLHFSTISGGQSLHDFLADLFGDLRSHAPSLPMTCSNTHSSNNTTAQWSSSTIAAVDDVVDFHDFHPYYNGMVAADLAPAIAATSKPILLGEYGAGYTEPTRTDRITAAAALYTLPQVAGSFYWALTDYNNTDPAMAWGLYDTTYTARTAPITAFKTVADREGSLPGAGHIVEDEGVTLPARSRLNFVGSGATATDDPTNDRTTVTITGTDPEVVRDTMAAALVQGANITITGNDAGDTITIASSATGAELLMQDGVTGPPVPLENEARSDWLYEG